MRNETRVLEMDRYEHGTLINALNELRNDLIKEARPTDAVDELLLKTIDAPTVKEKKRRDKDEER